MADAKISADPTATLTGTELIPVVQSGANKTTTPDALATHVLGSEADATLGTLTLTETNDDATTPLLTAHAGAFRATGTTETGVPDADVLYTAVASGTAGNAITITYDALGPSESLAIAVVSSAITVHLATDGGATPTSTASAVRAAVNGNGSAAALVTATLAPGNDGTGLPGVLTVQLSGGAAAADVAWFDERGVLNVQLQTGLGLDALNIRDPNGVIVGHLDNDGGFGFASDRFALSQQGNVSVNTAADLPLVGSPTFGYSVNGFGLFQIAAGGGYGVSVSSPVAGDIVLSAAAGTGQTADIFVAFDEDFNKVVRVLPRGAIIIAQHTAPDDADIATGQMAIWFDQTNGAAKLKIKGKSADGTVVAGEVALT